jgi:hypothetical protein
VRGGFPHQPAKATSVQRRAPYGPGSSDQRPSVSAKTGHDPSPQGIATHRNARSVSRDVEPNARPDLPLAQQAGTLAQRPIGPAIMPIFLYITVTAGPFDWPPTVVSIWLRGRR